MSDTLDSPSEILNAQRARLAQIANTSIVQQASSAATSAAPATGQTDFRLRVSPLNTTEVYGNSPLLSVLNETQGMMFPYTPTINFTQGVEYDSQAMPHTIADLLSYKYTPTVELQITGKFSVQNGREARYALACIHFLRVVSKMYFGEQAGNLAGLPPPILVLDGYGPYMFSKLRCILRSHNWTFDEQQELVPFVVNGQTCRLPPLFTLAITVKVTQTPMQLRKNFSLTDFRSGKLMEGGGWI